MARNFRTLKTEKRRSLLCVTAGELAQGVVEPRAMGSWNHSESARLLRCRIEVEHDLEASVFGFLGTGPIGVPVVDFEIAWHAAITFGALPQEIVAKQLAHRFVDSAVSDKLGEARAAFDETIDACVLLSLKPASKYFFPCFLSHFRDLFDLRMAESLTQVQEAETLEVLELLLGQHDDS